MGGHTVADLGKRPVDDNAVRGATRAARIVTEVLAPAVLAAVMPVVVALDSASTLLAGTAWGATAMLFSAVIPFSVVLYGVRSGQLTDRHIRQREQRRVPLLWGLASVLTSLVLFVLLGAPRALTAMVAVMLTVLAVIAVVNRWWNLSAHAAVSAGSAAVLMILFGWALAVAWIAVGVVCWSRVRLRDHTVSQVVAGATAGSATAAVVFLAMV